MQNVDFKKPLFIVAAVVALIAILSPVLGWFEIGNELVRSLADAELAKKENISIGLGILCLLLFVTSLVSKKHRLSFAVVPFALYDLVLVINQKPSDLVAGQLQLSVMPGYWVSILAALGIAALGVIIGLKGFEVAKPKAEQ